MVYSTYSLGYESSVFSYMTYLFMEGRIEKWQRQFIPWKRLVTQSRQGDPKSSLCFFARGVINLCRSVAVSTTSRSRPLAAHFKISFVPIRYVFLLFKQVLIFALQLKIRFGLTTLEQGLCCTSCHLQTCVNISCAAVAYRWMGALVT